MGGLTTTATYYDGVRVPAGNLVGEENGGWGLITNQLNHERVALAAIGMQAEDFYAAALDARPYPRSGDGAAPGRRAVGAVAAGRGARPAGGDAPAQLAFGGRCGGGHAGARATRAA